MPSAPKTVALGNGAMAVSDAAVAGWGSSGAHAPLASAAAASSALVPSERRLAARASGRSGAAGGARQTRSADRDASGRIAAAAASARPSVSKDDHAMPRKPGAKAREPAD